MSAIDEVKQRTDIVDVVSQYAKLTKSGRGLKGLCPFHSEKTPSFFVFPDRQSWHCFGACATGGDVFSFLMRKEGIEFGEALRRLADRAGVALPAYREADSKKELKQRLYEINEAAAVYFHEMLMASQAAAKARNYLQSRDVSPESLERFRLGYARESWDALKSYLGNRGFTEQDMVDAGLIASGEAGNTYDRWRDRLMFPIADDRGHVVGFGARVLQADVQGPKYINTPQSPVFDKSAILYGLHLASESIRKQDRAVIVEGYMDVIAAHQHGFTNVVASMGTSVTEKQIATLKRLSRNVVMALDPDSAGAEAMRRCVQHENALESEMKMVILPDGKDPDDVIKANPQSWQELIDNAKPIIDYIFESVVAALDLRKVADRSKARDRLYPVVDDIRDIVRRAHYLQKLAGLIGISDASLEASMRKKETEARARPSSRTGLAAGRDSMFRSAIEEYCLALLLQYPELRERATSLPVEYFENSENQAVFSAWLNGEGLTLQQLRDSVDEAVREHFDEIAGRAIVPGQVENKYTDCVLRLREKFLRNLERKREAALFTENDVDGELARSKEVSQGLKQIFELKARREQGLRS